MKLTVAGMTKSNKIELTIEESYFVVVSNHHHGNYMMDF